MLELRCPGRIHGILDGNVLKMRCFTKVPCGAGNGVVVEHYFNIETGQIIETRKFRDPAKLRAQKKEAV